jgi:hypothetical protein
MKELKVGEKVTIEAVEQEGCDGCFFSSDMNHTCNDPYKNNEGDDIFECRESKRSDHKNVIFKEVKDQLQHLLFGLNINSEMEV